MYGKGAVKRKDKHFPEISKFRMIGNRRMIVGSSIRSMMGTNFRSFHLSEISRTIK